MKGRDRKFWERAVVEYFGEGEFEEFFGKPLDLSDFGMRRDRVGDNDCFRLEAFNGGILIPYREVGDRTSFVVGGIMYINNPVVKAELN